MRMALAGGGTGGHLFPGLALARHAATEGMVSSVLFFGAERGIEATLVPEHGFEVFAQPLTPVRGRGPADALVALVRLAGAAWVVRGELKRRRIDVMVGLGGYASVAGTMGAEWPRFPLCFSNRTEFLQKRFSFCMRKIRFSHNHFYSSIN